MRANIETSKAVGTIGKQSDQIKYQEGNGYLNDRRLESFGHLLADYVLTGAELTIDSVQSNKIHISEGIISFSDQLWRVFISDFIVPSNTTYFIGFLTGTGYILTPTEPLKDYMKLWTIEVNANGVVTKQIDHRGKLNRVKFKATYDGVYLNTEEIKEAVATITGAVADAEVAVTTATTAIGEAEKAIVRADGAVNRTNTVIETATQSIAEMNAVKTTANQLVTEVAAVKEDTITQTAKTVKATNDAIQVTGSVNQKLTDVQTLAENFSFRNPYNVTTVYRKNNVVYHAKGSWIYTNNTPGAGISPPSLPTISNTHWHLVAMPGENGTGTGTVTEVDGALPGVTGIVVTHTNKDVLDGFSDDGTGKVKYKGAELVGKVTSVNGQEGDITGLETVTDADRKHTKTLGDANKYTDQQIASIVPSDEIGTFDGRMIKINTLPMDRIIGLQEDLEEKTTNISSLITTVTGIEDIINQLILDIGNKPELTTAEKENLVKAINEINAKPTGGDTSGLTKQMNTLYDLTTSLIRYQAHDELLKQAKDRLENGNGTVFAHDMNGNIIGMTLDEANSQNIVIRDGKMMMIGK